MEIKVKKRFSITTYVTPETFRAIEEERGILYRSAFCAMVLEEIFNPQKLECSNDKGANNG